MIKSYLKNDDLQILIIGYPRLEDTRSKIAVLSSDYADTAENEPSEILNFGCRLTTDRGPRNLRMQMRSACFTAPRDGSPGCLAPQNSCEGL